jgi:peptidoglycan/LPS O-acetylase OafA/YrhL
VNTAASERVLGWDLLRGLCALTVALYHLLYWLELAELPALSTYGVYLFFVLSGASLAYNYGAERVRSPAAIGRFLLARWLRLAPLYLLLCGVYIAMLAAHNGPLPLDRVARYLALNASFAFGAWDPSLNALLIGGWSLGIEFVFYLFFPLIAQLLPRRAWSGAVFVALTVLQFWWIQRTLGALGWDKGVVAYHQVPAFAAYFFGGCVIGALRRAGEGGWPFAAGLAAWAGMGVLLMALMPENPGDELLGVRGAVLFAASFAVVHVSGQVRVPPRAQGLAEWFGDITYGCYLLHPILIWTVLWFVAPKAPEWGTAARVALLLAILATTCVLATLSERKFERPLRRLARGGRSRPPYIEASSISR